MLNVYNVDVGPPLALFSTWSSSKRVDARSGADSISGLLLLRRLGAPPLSFPDPGEAAVLLELWGVLLLDARFSLLRGVFRVALNSECSDELATPSPTETGAFAAGVSFTRTTFVVDGGSGVNGGGVRSSGGGGGVTGS